MYLGYNNLILILWIDFMHIIGIDLFAGAGGLSLGAEMAGIDVRYAIEIEINSANTYKNNHIHTKVICDDIRRIDANNFVVNDDKLCVLFGGPPCQGFSTANQKTRNKDNPQNWLFREFIRFVELLSPDWLVLENVKGIIGTKNGFFAKMIEDEFSRLGYKNTRLILSAYDYGVPQLRSRVFFVGSKRGYIIEAPEKNYEYTDVGQAIGDLPKLKNGADIDCLEYGKGIPSLYAQRLRCNLSSCRGHLVTKNADYVIDRYKCIPQGGNWQDIPIDMMKNYKDRTRCHTDIYRRLKSDAPAVTVGNYRKSMLIHPWENRGLSVREAARLQSFPDYYNFYGSIGYQQQQVGNAVPPYLAKAVFSKIIETERIYFY